MTKPISLSRVTPPENYFVPDRDFYSRPTLTVAKMLLGACLYHVTSDGIAGGMIVETEGYLWKNDPGCHAFNGKTPRNSAMFGPPGFAYTYFTYGNHWLFNVVTEKEGFGCAVLIRAIEPVEGIELMWHRRPKAKKITDLTNGPGKLAAALAIGRDQYGADLINSSLVIFFPDKIKRAEIQKKNGGIIRTTRIGITLGSELPYRFYLKNNDFISRP